MDEWSDCSLPLLYCSCCSLLSHDRNLHAMRTQIRLRLLRFASFLSLLAAAATLPPLDLHSSFPDCPTAHLPRNACDKPQCAICTLLQRQPTRISALGAACCCFLSVLLRNRRLCCATFSASLCSYIQYTFASHQYVYACARERRSRQMWKARASGHGGSGPRSNALALLCIRSR